MNQIVMVTSEVDSNNSERFETKTDFTPDVDGLYVFRRVIVVSADRTEQFETKIGDETISYEGYYFKDGNYYKISNLVTTPDLTADLANDGNKKDGILLNATAGFYEEKQLK